MRRTERGPPGRPPHRPTINFSQANLNEIWPAEQLLAQTAFDTGADILITSEPAVHHGDEKQWVFSSDRKSAAGISRHSALSHDGHGSGEGFAWLSFGELTVFSCYWRPGSTLQDFALFLGHLEDAIRARGNSQIVLIGDFNAWGSRVSNPRGCLLSDLAVSLALILANERDAPTFARGAATSIIDVSFYRRVVCTGWRVLEDESLSDHQYIYFSSAGHPPKPDRPPTHLSNGPCASSTRRR